LKHPLRCDRVWEIINIRIRICQYMVLDPAFLLHNKKTVRCKELQKI